MSFARRFECVARTAGVMFAYSEIINDEALPAAKDFDPLLAEQLVSTRQVGYLAHGAILKTQGNGDIVLVRHEGVVGGHGDRVDTHRLRTGEKQHQVDEMAHLAQNTSAALLRLRPVLLWQESRVDAIVDEQRSGNALEHLSGLASKGRETPVISDHETAIAPTAGNFQDICELVLMDRQRLFDEDVLARFERGRRERRMRVVPGGNEHGVDGPVREDLVCIGRVRLEPEFLARALRCNSPCGHDRKQVTSLPGIRDEKLLREAAGTDERNARFVWGGVNRSRRRFNGLCRWDLRVLEKDAQVTLQNFPGHDVIRLLCVLYFKHMGDQRLLVHAAVFE